MSSSKGMWTMLMLLGASMLGVALGYQYLAGDAPCVVCVHVRLWVIAMVLVSIVGLVLPENRAAQIPALLLMLVSVGGLLERSWHTLAVEKQWIISSCGFDLGLPEWFAVDRWAPWLFEPQGMCGYTPEIAFGITMAEALMATSVMAGIYVLVAGYRCCLSRKFFHR